MSSIRPIFFWSIGLTILAGATVFSGSSATLQVAGDSVYLKGTGGRGPYLLPQTFIIRESLEVVSSSDTPLPAAEYEFNSSTSSLYLSSPVGVGDSILVIYSYLKTELKKRYYHRELSIQSIPEATINMSPAAKTEANVVKTRVNQSSSAFELKGNKSFSLEAGNSRDLQFKQGLDLTFQGKIAEDVQVAAFLSDRGDFYAPQGSTQRLEELDKLRMEINSPHFQGSLGDQQIDYSSARLAGFSKKIKGAQSRVSFSNFSIETTVANSKGTFHTNQIQGQDGKQGPYSLSDQRGQTGITVLSGTEKVWLDGELLQRGSDLDYTMDYLTGSLQFAPGRLITSQSVIRVDFEYAQEDFSKKLVATRAQMNLRDGTIKLGGSFVSEGDLRGSPLGLSLSSAQKEILISAGDIEGRAQQSGATWVGTNLGDYILATDSSGRSFYKYVGQDQGDYQVRFSLVGEKKGDYIYQGAGVFTYLGENQGNYAPLQNLPMPRNHSILGLDLALQPNANWDIKLELARSNLDQNTFSSLNDNDNKGWGFDSRVDFKHTDFGLLGKKINQFRTSGGLFIQNENFMPLSRLGETEADRIWNLNPAIQTRRELKWHFSPQLILGRNFSVATYMGRLRRGNEFSSSRTSWNFSLPWFSAGSFNFNLDKTKSRFNPPGDSLAAGDLQWKNQLLKWNQPVRRWVLRSAYSREERRQIASGQRWRKLEFGLGSNSTSILAYQADWTQTGTDTYRTSWRSHSAARTWRVRGSIREWKNAITTSWEYTRNQIEYARSDSGSTIQNLALWRLDYSAPRSFLNLELRYLVNQGGVALKSYNYVQVPGGQGEYRFENGEYVPDPHGNYDLLIENSGSFRQTLSGEKSFHLAVEPARVGSKKTSAGAMENLLAWLRSDSYLRLESQVADNSGLKVDFLLPWQTLQSDSSYLENYNWQQELKITPSFTRHYVVLRWQKENLKNFRYISSSQENQNFERSLAAYLKLGLTNLLELRHLHSVKEQKFTGYPSHRIQGEQLSFVFTKRVSNSSQYSLNGKYLSEEDQLQSISSQVYSVSPSFVYSNSSMMKWQGKVGWSRVNSEAGYLSWLLAEGKKKGDNFDWDFGLDLELKQNFHYRAHYRGNLTARRSPLHFFKLDLTATF